MGFAIIKRPVQIINGNSFKWLPAHQPITFEVERRDATIAKVQALFSGGQISATRLTINAPLSYFNVKKGGRVSIFTPSTIVYTIINVINDYTFDVNITIGSQVPNIGSTLNFMDALYYLEMKVSYTENNFQYKEIGTLKAKTDSNGIARFNVQELLATKTINQNDFLYNKINEGQWGEGTRFNVQIRQWLYITITTPNATNNYSNLVDSNVFYYTNSANQIQNQYGYNMAEYEPNTDTTREAKFQSVFKRPTYFVNYPFSLNFIYSNQLENFDIYRLEDQKDINGTIITSSSYLLNLSQRELANRLMLEEGYTSNIKYIDVWLDTQALPTEIDPYIWGEGDGFPVEYDPNDQYVMDYYQPYTKHNGYEYGYEQGFS
jgi:hypothetical protein